MKNKFFYIKSLRKFRVWHRRTSVLLAIFIFVSSVTGILLAWKKNVDVLQPPTQKGISKDFTTWQPVHQLAKIAEDTLLKHQGVANKVNRVDCRPSKGIVKVLFKNGNWEVQVDAVSGEVKSIGKRHADWIESLHDGSIVSDLFKLISMNVLGIGIILLVLTGLWLWYGPKRIRALKRKNNYF